ncbi:hypothetical protein BY458DRAFT_428054 [Sporodiniella umbellata]|nr:hypothetical protein BY458DRAFT_428054 [Sporodiniella umbellata]
MMETLTPTKTPLAKKLEAVVATECANCGTTTTPLWRRGPNGETICNACGLYLKARNTLRPPTMKKTNKKEKNDCGGGTFNRQALMCANCRTTTTPLWRRDEAGNTICNACGLYYKLHNVHRPVSMKRSVIKRRKRITVAQGSDEGEEMEDIPEIEDFVVKKKPVIVSSSPAPAAAPVLTPLKQKYELADFDTALDKLEHLRRQVRPDQALALSELTFALTDLATRAESALSFGYRQS